MYLEMMDEDGELAAADAYLKKFCRLIVKKGQATANVFVGKERKITREGTRG